MLAQCAESVRYGKRGENMIEIKPTGCEGCIKLRPRIDGDVRIYDYCSAFDCTVTDEMNNTCGYWCGVMNA